MHPNSKRTHEALPESASILLDFIRLAAALMVVVCHMTRDDIRLGLHYQKLAGDIAVPVFFVLSGFVIRYVTSTRESTAIEYFIDRASRIYSVVFPAMLFTLLVSGLCYLIDGRHFLQEWSRASEHPAQRVVLNLLFLSQAWGHNTVPFVNSPFWSLGYECLYYVLYGFIFYLRGWKRIIGVTVIAGVIGPQVMFLFPVWWLGCVLFDILVLCRATWISRVAIGIYATWIISGLMLYIAGYRLLLLAPLNLFESIDSMRNPISLVGMDPVRATMFAVATGVFCFVLLFPLLLACDYIVVSRSNEAAKGFRVVANGTFVIYLMHYPFLVLLMFTGILIPSHPIRDYSIVTLICALLTAVAVPLDTLKIEMRRWLRLKTLRSPS